MQKARITGKILINSFNRKQIMNAKEIESAIAQKLESLFITFSVVYAGETVKENDWKCDAWRITFKRGAQHAFKQFDTDYFTGLGHRKSKLKRPHFVNPRSIAAAEWDRNNLKPVAPNAASVLHSALMDGKAIETSFKYWCDEYDYDSDSISAFNTYNACCAIGEKVNAFFSSTEREELETLLQDY
jgi:hypothetical protein